jgi:hypothetical protein
MANTSILIKRSLNTSAPTSLNAGELAYSYLSNTAFIGTSTGDGVVKIGGQYYTDIIDNATSAATPLTVVKRDASGNAEFNFITANIIGEIIGNANSATQLKTPRDFSISGSDITATAQSFNGTSNVILNASLNAVPGLSSGYYGGSTQSSSTIPVIQVAANGRIMSIANTIVTSAFDISDGTSSNTIYSGATFYHVGTQGITSTVTGNTVTFSTDNTILRSNNSVVGTQIINTDLEITGNLHIFGNTVTHNAETLNIADPLIYLAANNYSSDMVDIGFAANYYDGTTQRHTGVIRHAANKEYYIFDNYDDEPTNNIIDVDDPSFRLATLHANLTGGIITSLAQDISVSDGGTGISSFNIGEVVIGNGTSGLQQLANVSSINVSPSNNQTVSNITTDVYGRVIAFTAKDISELTVTQGGTGKTTFTSGELLVGNGTGAINSLANSSYTLTGGLSTANTITSVSVDAYGRVTGVTGQEIVLDTSQITSGTLPVTRGGTGQSTFGSGQIVIGSGTNGLQQLANVSSINTTLSSNNTVDNIQVDVWGRVTSFTTKAISGLNVDQGGTGFSTATSNGILFGNGTGSLQVTSAAGTSDQTWSNQILTTTNAGVPVWTTSLDGGQF